MRNGNIFEYFWNVALFKVERIEFSSISSTVRYSVPVITWGSFRGQHRKKRVLVRDRDHFGVDLGVISGSGSFRGLYNVSNILKTYALISSRLLVRVIWSDAV